MKHLAPPLFLALLCVALPAAAHACAILSKEQAAQQQRDLEEFLETQVLKGAEEAELLRAAK